MKRVNPRLVCGLGVMLLLGSTAAVVSADPPPERVRVVSVPGDVTSISADGMRVAAAVKMARGCDRAVVWLPALEILQTFTSRVACAGAAFHEMPEIAVGGERVEWLAVTGGNLQDMALETAVLGKARVSRVAFAENRAGAEGGVDGDWIGNLFGDGSVLVFGTWRECALTRPAASPPCPAGMLVGDVVFSQPKLWRLGTRKSLVRAGTNAYAVVGVDAGRIAVQDRVEGSVALVMPGGTVARTVRVPAGDFSGFAFQGRQLVVLRNGSLEVYDVVSGGDKPEKTIPVPAGKLKPVLRDVQSDLAVYVRGTQVHVVRIADGHEVRIGTAGTGRVDAQIEPAGLFYSYNLQGPVAGGRVAFLPRADLLKKFH